MLRHWTITLRWIDQTWGPPPFWKNGQHVMRISLDGNADAAVEAVRRTWGPHESEVIEVMERQSILD